MSDGRPELTFNDGEGRVRGFTASQLVLREHTSFS